jgi:predicted CXXCH cytochrome family protein
MRKWSIAAVCLILAITVAVLISTGWQGDVAPPHNQPPVVDRRTDYITSSGCQECHPAEYESWHDSFHRTMTQTASVESIVAPIDDITVRSRGRSYRFYRQGDQFRVQMVDPTWENQRQLRGLPVDGVKNLPIVDRQIVMTTGSHHHQVYWIMGRGRELRQVPFVYHIATKQWIPNEDSFLQPGSEERQTQRWNDNCIICHTVGGSPGYELVPNTTNLGTFNSTFVELGIACEACHGPGGRHAEAHRGDKMASQNSGTTANDPLIINPAKLDTRRSAAVCGQCHSHYIPRESVALEKNGFTKSFRPGELLDESRVIVRYNEARKQAHRRDEQLNPGERRPDSTADSFWNDGTHRVAGREYNGMTNSGCFQRGKLTCLSCHSMHNYREPNDQLSETLSGNDACLQCHKNFAERISQHTRHKADSTGSSCYNCHMPHTTYGLFKGIRSHRIDSPNSNKIAVSNRPNACNLCHLDQTLQWTVDNLHKWYDQPKVDLDKDNQTIAASILWLLKGDAAQRAIAVWSAGWKPARDASNPDWTIPYVAELLTDPYPANRFMASQTLKNLNVPFDSTYKFWGSEEDGQMERKRVIEAWQNTPRKNQPQRNQRLLLDLEGRPIRRELDRLLRLRNTKPISIAE